MEDPEAPPAPISRFPVPRLGALPADIQETIRATAGKAGFVPNIFLAYAWKPEQFRAFFAFYEVLMRGPSGLSRAEREMIAVAVSAANECLYCTVAHGAALRVLGRDPRVADELAASPAAAALTPRQRAIVDLAVKLARAPAALAAADLEPPRRAGLTDADIWDVGAVAAFFNLSNRMASLADLRPNPEFHALGR